MFSGDAIRPIQRRHLTAQPAAPSDIIALVTMNREQFFRVVSGLDEDRLRKALWNLYWRGTANVRERIEVELASDGRGRPPRPAKAPADPETVRDEVDDFVALARSGAYLGGDRRVSPRERSRWRFTFKRLAAEAQDALRAEDAGPAASALEQLIDLACEAHDYDYFRSDDPVAAAGFVVSDAAAVLWASTWERHGFQAFAETAAPQLIRWESRYGWTRYGEGSVAAKETSLAVVLARMLRVPDTWEGFAEQYVRALDRLCDRGASTRQVRRSARYRAGASQRAGGMARPPAGKPGGHRGRSARQDRRARRLGRSGADVPLRAARAPTRQHRRRPRPGGAMSAKAARPQRLPRVRCRDRRDGPGVSTACSATAGRARRAAGRRPCRRGRLHRRGTCRGA